MRDFVGICLVTTGVFCLVSGLIYAASSSELWFTRAAVGFILLGLWYAGGSNND